MSVRKCFLISINIFLFIFALNIYSIAKNGNNVKKYNDILCYMITDSMVVNKLSLIVPDTFSIKNWNKKVAISKDLMDFSISGFKNEVKKFASESEISKWTNPLYFPKYIKKTIYVNGISCGIDSTSPIKVFFSEIRNNFIVIEIGYSHLSLSKYKSRSDYYFSPFLLIIYKKVGKKIINLGVKKGYN